jgi:hypothetical protein
LSNFRSHPCVSLKMKWLLKPLLDQNSIMIYYKSNGNFKSHIIFGWIQEGLVALLINVW